MNTDIYKKYGWLADGIRDIPDTKQVLTGMPEFVLPFLAGVFSARWDRAVEILVIDEVTALGNNTPGLLISRGKNLDLSGLDSLELERVSKVWNENEYSVLGDVVIAWPKGNINPFRLSLFDGIVEEIAVVDSQTRQKCGTVESLRIGNSAGVLRRYMSETPDAGLGKTMTLYYPSSEDFDMSEGVVKTRMDIRKVPGIYANNTDRTISNIIDAYTKQGYRAYYMGEKVDFNRYFLEGKFAGMDIVPDSPLVHGFIMHGTKSLVLTANDILGLFDLTDGNERNITGDEVFRKFAIGDFVVHEDHGIGIFAGVKESGDVEYIELKYSGKDRLLIPTTQFKKLSRYIGAGKQVPVLTGLNSGVWKRVKRGVEHDVMEIAKELVQLYAVRNSMTTGPVIDTYEKEQEYRKFAEEFEFEDTEDQYIISNQLLEDFKKEKLMDRLIIGDVGFGKTEMAYRAAYAAANAGLQVAFLAPTTILVHQHLRNMLERFKSHPFEIREISRLITGGDRDETLTDLEAGKIDIIVGTHSLLSDAVKFKNLGLIIIDEEQKFGVKQKEKLKMKRSQTHVLSLTATPIPRTLSIAMNGIRDMSILASVPQDRKAISNWFGDFNWGVVNQAIAKELERGGQVYYLHNRVADLDNIRKDLENLNPGVRVGVVNGRMGSGKINEVMKEFIDGKFNVLLSTTIIENGLDIRNVNTLIVDDSQRYGLSQLYQIRGRIGRSDRQAYAFFMHQNLQGQSEQRLDALEESEALGSGFLLSNRDLEIRGAGNILGREQSGVINSVGYGLYSQMLKEAVDSLR